MQNAKEADGKVRMSARERILSTARALFYRHGVRAVGVDRIIAEAGVAKMTFYNHFPSKDDLVTAAVRRNDEMWRTGLMKRIPALPIDPEQKLLAVFDEFKEWFGSEDFRGCPFVNIAVDIADRQSPAHRAVVEHREFLEQFLSTLAREAGIPDPEVLAGRLAIILSGATYSAYLSASSAPADEAKAMAIGLIESARSRSRSA